MKYLFINSTAGVGSTGKIAADTCRNLMAQGHTCRIAYGRFAPGCPDIETYRICSPLETKINGLLCRVLDNHGFGLRHSTRKFIAWIREYDPDVIWLHNLHGYYLHVGLLFSYLRTCGKQIIWTLHDCWTITGHCAHFEYADCRRWKTGCHHCPQKKAYPSCYFLDHSRKNQEKKKNLFAGIPGLRLITPSRWLKDIVLQSYLSEYPVEVRHNTIDEGVFHPTPGTFREEYGLENKKILLAVTGFWTPQKGIGDLIRLAGMLKDSEKLVLVGKYSGSLPENILHIDRTENQKKLAEIYTEADVLLNPTYEDTYPTVNLEALACGLPVITYRTGGSPESLDEWSGAVTDRNPEAMLKAVRESRFLKENCLRRFKTVNRPDF